MPRRRSWETCGNAGRTGVTLTCASDLVIIGVR